MPTLNSTTPINFHLKQNDTWTRVKFDKTDGHIKNTPNSETLTLEASRVYDCVEDDGRKVFWIIMNTEDEIFRVDWMPHPNNPTPSKWMLWKDDKRSALPDDVKSLFSDVTLDPITASYENSLREPVLPIATTDEQPDFRQPDPVRPEQMIDELEQDAVRLPDSVRTERLIGGNESPIHHAPVLQPEITDFDLFLEQLVLTPPYECLVLLSTTEIQLSAEQLKILLNLFDHKLES